jgi:hypothetical protein
MRKLLKKYGFVPDRLITDDLRSYGAAARDLGIEKRHERGRWKNNRAENSHQPTGDESARCRASRAEDQPSAFSQPMQPSTTPSTSNVIYISVNAPRLPRRCDGHLARGGRLRNYDTQLFAFLVQQRDKAVLTGRPADVLHKALGWRGRRIGFLYLISFPSG